MNARKRRRSDLLRLSPAARLSDYLTPEWTRRLSYSPTYWTWCNSPVPLPRAHLNPPSIPPGTPHDVTHSIQKKTSWLSVCLDVGLSVDHYYLHWKKFHWFKKNFFESNKFVQFYTGNEKCLWFNEISWLLFTFSSWMRRYWFYVKNHFWNFHHIFTFLYPLSQKKRFL